MDDFFSSLATFFVDCLETLAAPFVYASKEFFFWLLELILKSVGMPLLEHLFSRIPSEQLSSGISDVVSFFAFVNEWIPLSFAYTCISIYVEFILSMIIVKLIVKLFVPTVG